MKHFFCIAFAFLLFFICAQSGRSESQALASSPAWRVLNFQSRNQLPRPFVRIFRGTSTKVSENRPKVETVQVETVQVEAVPEAKEENWKPLFDGEALTDWIVPAYGGDGEVSVKEGKIVIERGLMMTGIRYDKEFPTIDYEIRYEARRTGGYDFFAACTFPVKGSFCTFVNGGWGGGVIGLSSINGYDASENETTKYHAFKENLWYRFHIRVREEQIQVWITPQNKEGDWETEKLVVDLEMDTNKKLSTRFEMNLYKPLGISTWNTEGQLRNIEYRKVKE